jgi:L-alanine-DL-glutamate epimerase-like enolase superfamily enzyme
MRIATVSARAFDVPLSRPYAIANGHWDAVELAFVIVRGDDGQQGHGMAAPAVEVTGETRDAALAELRRASWLVGRDLDDAAVVVDLEQRVAGPGARAAIDMALCDLGASRRALPLVEHFGRVHAHLATSITIGCKPVAETLLEANEYVARGFTALKVKIGESIDLDLERLTRLRERFGARVQLRADANQGYDERAMLRLAARANDLDLEMIEQPMPRGQESFLRTLPRHVQLMLCADESVHDERALDELVAAGCPFGVVNIKLQKCGGPRAALRLARACERHGLAIMWGCNDESALGIAAALHTAFACNATRFLDLDGSLDLAADPYEGGFAIREGRMSTLSRPGLGALPVPS